MLSSGWLAPYVGQSEVPALITSLSFDLTDGLVFMVGSHARTKPLQMCFKVYEEVTGELVSGNQFPGCPHVVPGSEMTGSPKFRFQY